ncbi:MAG: hypothetical protein Q8O62_06305 [Aequorivita sp.]|nr:hypothetical protein [Aequorivita sp.]
MKNIILTTLVLITISLQAQKLPEDALDKNSILLFHPTASVEDNQETLNIFSENIITAGFNLVGKYLYTDTEISLKEIEFDIKNKEVKYIFLLTYNFYKGPDYDLYFFENNAEINPNIFDPKKVIVQLKPGFVTSGDPRNTIIKKLGKEVEEFKQKYPNAGNQKYDDTLVNEIVLTENETNDLMDMNLKNTLIDGTNLTVEHEGVPNGLKEGKLAVVGIGEKEYRLYKQVNSILESSFKKYAFQYEFFPNYEAYESKGGDKAYTHRLQLIKTNTSFMSKSQKQFTSTETAKRDMGDDSVKPSRSTSSKNYEKDLFAIVIKENASQERYVATDTGFIKYTLNKFISEL